MMASVGIIEPIDQQNVDESSVGESSPGRWVVCIDGSDHGEHALSWALLHGPRRASTIELFTAWQVPIYGPYPVDGAIAMPYDDRALAGAALQSVEELAERTRSAVEVPVSASAVRGGAAATLLEAAKGSDLLVLGSRGRGGFRSLLLGSTSGQCAAHASVPTVVVRGGKPHLTRRILVGVDGSANSLAALRWAVDFAAPESAVVAVQVWDASPLAVGADEFFFPDASAIASTRFNHLVDGLAEVADSRAVSLERQFLHGRPRNVLAEAAASVDLVVAGARGHGAVAATLLGSVTTSLLHHLDRPLVVVPDPSTAP
jgi:nucleotide-binding universal stress UspA family protein